MAPPPLCASEEGPSRMLSRGTVGPGGCRCASDSEDVLGAEDAAFGELEGAPTLAEHETSVDGSVQEELSKLVDGLVGEDGRIRLGDFEKLSGCSPSILDALQKKLPRQLCWNVSQVKEVLLKEVVPPHTCLPTFTDSSNAPSVSGRYQLQEGCSECPTRFPCSTDLPQNGNVTEADSQPCASSSVGDLAQCSVSIVFVRDEAVLTPKSFTPQSANVVTPSGTRSRGSPAVSSRRPRPSTPQGHMVASPSPFRGQGSRVHKERLDREPSFSADFTFSAGMIFRQVAQSPACTAAEDQEVQSGVEDDAELDVENAPAQHRSRSSTLSNCDELSPLMNRVVSPRYQSIARGPKVGGLPGTMKIVSSMSQSGSSGDRSAVAPETTAGGSDCRMRSRTVDVLGQGMGSFEGEPGFAPWLGQASEWLSPDLQEVAALLQRGTWNRSGEFTDKVGNRSEYTGHGKQARYFERLDNVMEGDNMEQLVKRAKRKVFVYIQNAFPTPEGQSLTGRCDSSFFTYPESSKHRRSSSLWNGANFSIEGEVAKEGEREDSSASAFFSERSSVNKVLKATDRNKTSNAIDGGSGTDVTAEEEAIVATGNKGERVGDAVHERHVAAVDGGLVLDWTHAAHLKMSFLQMTDFFLSLCYHFGILFNKEKEQKLEERQHLQDTVDRYKTRVQLMEQKLKINFDIVQQQREQLDALEREIQTRDDIDRRRERVIVELQSRLRKEHQTHIEELRKRDEDVEESRRLYDVLKRKHVKVSDENATLHDQLESAEEKIANLTATAAKRAASRQLQYGTKVFSDTLARTSLVEEMASLLSLPSISGYRAYTQPLRRPERGSQMLAFHKLAQKIDVDSGIRGMSLLEELLRTGSDMNLPQIQKRRASEPPSGPTTQQWSLPLERCEEEAPSGRVSGVAPEPAVVLLHGEEPPLPSVMFPPESPPQSTSSPTRESVGRLLLCYLSSGTEELVCPPPDERLPHHIIKTVIRRVVRVEKPSLMRRWKALKAQKRLLSTQKRQAQRDSTSELLEWLEVKVCPEMPEKTKRPRDLHFVAALGHQALMLQMKQCQRRRERHGSRHRPSGKSIIQEFLNRHVATCQSCTANCARELSTREENINDFFHD
ncbi:hypothetical protein TGP89_225560 [Toxoplasma gondii p89]|uniref:Uncharacterized protein n=1 Tax=Toxoplasma gondii p89 TaxID=943119 RepID=A0A086KEM8_TOXGO|nr:hypothetical protein TGP89_225560 [Toxoplasma gondii p89]